jgi:hypothetical protein
LLAANLDHQFQTWFTDQGVRLTPRGGSPWLWGLTLKTYGVGPNRFAIPPAKPSTASANRVEYRHHELVEWYLNDANGLEQGFTLMAPPARQASVSSLFEITFADMAAQGDKADIDGTVRAFVIHSVSSGAIKIGANTVTASVFAAGSNDTIDAANNADWTPPAKTSGSLDAFAVTAADIEALRRQLRD